MTDKTLGQIAYEADYLNTMSPGWPWEKISLKSRYAYERIGQVVAAHVRATDAAPAVAVEPISYEIKATPRGVQFTIGVQTFALHDTRFDPNEPQRQKFYVDMLGLAFSLIAKSKAAPPETDAHVRAVETMRETLQSIANANPRNWQELAEPMSEFERWAKSRALHALRWP